MQQQSKPHRLVLASGSPRRREILSRLGLPFEVVPASSALEDSFVESPSPAGASRAVRIATALAEMKAQSVFRDLPASPSAQGPELLVLGADTVVAVGEGASEQVLGKPRDPEDAARMLRILSGRDHFVVTAVALARPGKRVQVRWERSVVRFRALSSETIQGYVSTGEPMDKAGAYAIQGLGETLVAGFSGCFHNIVGLPLVLVARMLEGVAALPSCDCGLHPLQEGLPGCR